MAELIRNMEDAGQVKSRVWGEGKERLVFKLDGPDSASSDRRPPG